MILSSCNKNFYLIETRKGFNYILFKLYHKKEIIYKKN